MNNIQVQDEIDMQFIQTVINEVTVSCALPFTVPVDRIPAFILQAAKYFWQNSDLASEERYYFIKNADICKGQGSNRMNKILKLPEQILGVHGVYKAQNQMKYGIMGDFSLERMMMTTYSQFGGTGVIGGGFNGTSGMAGYTLTDVVTSMYEVDTFNQTLNAPLTFNYNMFSHKLTLLGDITYQDILIDCFKRCTIQELYNDYYFFRFVVCLVKRSLTTLYNTFEFKLPGGVTIHFESFKEDADSELDDIKEYIQNNRGNSFIFQPNTL